MCSANHSVGTGRDARRGDAPCPSSASSSSAGKSLQSHAGITLGGRGAHGTATGNPGMGGLLPQWTMKLGSKRSRVPEKSREENR
ncbi:uncharacterized protein LOC144087356 isoform X2 [Stigmatopora argus]